MAAAIRGDRQLIIMNVSECYWFTSVVVGVLLYIIYLRECERVGGVLRRQLCVSESSCFGGPSRSRAFTNFLQRYISGTATKTLYLEWDQNNDQLLTIKVNIVEWGLLISEYFCRLLLSTGVTVTFFTKYVEMYSWAACWFIMAFSVC